ncbi:esterase, partial [Actinomadura kijaniata]
PTPTPTPSPECITASNYAHTMAARAYASWGNTYARGSNQALGLWNTTTNSTLKQTSPGYWGKC